MIVFLCSFPWGPGIEFMILDLLYLMRQKTSLTKIAFNIDVCVVHWTGFMFSLLATRKISILTR